MLHDRLPDDTNDRVYDWNCPPEMAKIPANCRENKETGRDGNGDWFAHDSLHRQHISLFYKDCMCFQRPRNSPVLSATYTASAARLRTLRLCGPRLAQNRAPKSLSALLVVPFTAVFAQIRSQSASNPRALTASAFIECQAACVAHPKTGGAQCAWRVVRSPRP